MFQQVADPVAGSLALSALCAALPLATLFVLLSALHWKAWQAALTSLAVALLVAIVAFGMPTGQALLAGTEGAASGCSRSCSSCWPRSGPSGSPR